MAHEPVEGPWDLPDGWSWQLLGELGDWYGGGTPSKAVPAYWTGGDIPWISPKDMKRFDLHDTEDHITEDAVAGSATRLVPANSVVCVMRSGILKHSFPVAITSRSMTLNQDLRAVHPRGDVSPRYLGYFLRSAGQSILHDCSKDGTTVDSIEAGRLMSVAVPLPVSRDLQDRIVARIDALFAEIDAGEEALASARGAVETWRKSLLKAAVTGDLTADWRRENPPRETGEQLLHRILADRRARWHADPSSARKRYMEPTPPDTAILPDLPEGWTWANLDQLSSHETRNGLSIKDVPGPTEVRALRLGALAESEVNWSIFRYLPRTLASVEAYALQDGDLLVSRANGSPELVGKGALCREPPADMIFPDTAIRFRLIGGSALRNWLVRVWNSLLVRHQIGLLAKTTAGILKIAQGDITRIALPIPPMPEMLVASRIVEEQLAIANSGGLMYGLDDGSTLRQSILAAAFRGELVA